VVLSDFPSKVKAIVPPQIEIEGNEMDRLSAQAGDKLAAILRFRHGIAFALKATSEQRSNLGVIIDNEYALGAHDATQPKCEELI
jgi:hypothetical protein